MYWPNSRSTCPGRIRLLKRATGSSTCFFGCLRRTTEPVMCCWQTPPFLVPYSAATRASNISAEIKLLKRVHPAKGGSMTPVGNVLLELDDIQSDVLRP